MAAGALYFVAGMKTTKRGLYLRSGMSVVLTARGTKIAPVTQDAMSRAELVIRNRVDALGVAEPEIQRQGEASILIQLPGIKDSERALKIIGERALLEFKIVTGTGKDGKLKLGKPLMTGTSIAGAKPGYDENGRPEVALTFTDEGTKKFAEVTSQNVKQRLAIVLDKKIESSPTIQQPITDGRAVITGIESIEEVKRIALVLETGHLPVQMDISEQRTVGPTLGRDQLVAGVRAGAIGLIVVALFMVLMYRGMGLITTAALAIFASIFWGVIAVLGWKDLWAVTLPGIAGVILSIGVAADSSIILFERVKEEVRNGKTLRTAADTGFTHALRTLIDADLVTFVTAAALFIVGIGPVRGFALALMVGVVIDVFTFTMFTRCVLGLIAQQWPAGSALLGVREAE